MEQNYSLRIAERIDSNPVNGKASHCFLAQETLHSLLQSTGWFQERIPKCFIKLVASNTIKLK
jgi:hypothetical protein